MTVLKAIAHNRNTISDQVLWQAFNRFGLSYDSNAYNVKPEMD